MCRHFLTHYSICECRQSGHMSSLLSPLERHDGIVLFCLWIPDSCLSLCSVWVAEATYDDISYFGMIVAQAYGN